MIEEIELRYTYIAKAIGKMVFKIGKTYDFKRRISELNGARGFYPDYEFRPIAFSEWDFEQDILDEFKDHKVQHGKSRELLELSLDELRYICWRYEFKLTKTNGIPSRIIKKAIVPYKDGVPNYRTMLVLDAAIPIWLQ